MVEQGRLRYLKQHETDCRKWDRCILDAPNSRMYAASWYLDRTAIEWDALVWDDYRFVMPLPVRKKLGIKYLYQPLYTQQLGIFPAPPADIARKFYTALYEKFRFAGIQLNAANLPLKNSQNVQLSERKNFLLHLGTDFQNIVSSYSKNTRRNIAKAEKNNLNFTDTVPLEEFLEFKRTNLIVNLPESGFQKLKSIMAYSMYHGFGKITGVYSSQNNLCAAACFCRWGKRLIYLNGVSDEAGKENRAMFYLLNHFIKSAAGINMTIDFEGSMIPGVARFFEGFGATPEIYFRMTFNRLPFPLNRLKKA